MDQDTRKGVSMIRTRVVCRAPIDEDTPSYCLQAHGRERIAARIPHGPDCRCEYIKEVITDQDGKVSVNTFPYERTEEELAAELDQIALEIEAEIECPTCGGYTTVLCNQCSGNGCEGCYYKGVVNCPDCYDQPDIDESAERDAVQIYLDTFRWKLL